MTDRKILDDWLASIATTTHNKQLLPKAKKRMPASFSEKMSKLHKGKPKSAEQRAKMSAAKKGKKFTDEHKANMSIAQKRRFASQVKEPISKEPGKTSNDRSSKPN